MKGWNTMSEKGTSLAQYVEHFGLEILNHGDTYETDKVESTNVNRPDLQILGLFDYFDARRIQVMGKAELTYIMKMSENRRTKVFDDLFSYTIPALVLARNMECPAECLQCARNHGRTLLRTTERTADFTSHTMEYLSKQLAPCITRHGVLLDIYGEGVMITGDSGVGKSESAIELIMRGHRLVADDAVELRRISNQLIGTAPEVIRHYIELRGIGVIDVRRLFGMGAIKLKQQIDMVINLEPWNDNTVYDRLGLDQMQTEVLGVKLPSITIPVKPGRNLASIVEVAAMNNRHRKFGYNAAQELARDTNRTGKEIAALTELGVAFQVDSTTNQQFIYLSEEQADALRTRCTYDEEWRREGRVALRLCTSWATQLQAVDELIAALREIIR